jgi:hypothetical protein
MLSAKVARRKGDNGQLLSQGYGFVECSSEEVARAVVAKLQGSNLDGHHVALQISKRKAEQPAKEAKVGCLAEMCSWLLLGFHMQLAVLMPWRAAPAEGTAGSPACRSATTRTSDSQ